jgi:hypothetical protein
MALYAPDKMGHAEAALTTRTPAGASLTDTVTNDGATMLEFLNTSSSATVTIEAVTNCSHGYAHDVTVTVPATTGDIWLGPFPVSRFGNPLTITWPGTVTGLTFKALSTGGTVVGL